jgi:hypothetical protein
MIRAVHDVCACLEQGHAYGRLSRCRVVDHCVVQSASCMR